MTTTGRSARSVPGAGQAVQHGLDGAADAGRGRRRRTARPRDGRARNSTAVTSRSESARTPTSASWRGGRGGPAAQQESVDGPSPGLRGDDGGARERTPFPSGVGVGEYGDPQRCRGTCWHVADARKRIPVTGPTQRQQRVNSTPPNGESAAGMPGTAWFTGSATSSFT